MDFLPEIIEGRMKGVWQLRGSFFFFSILSAAIFNLKNFDFLFYVLFIFFLFFYIFLQKQEGEEEFKCYKIWQMMVALLHSNRQPEKRCQKPAVQQKTTDDDDDQIWYSDVNFPSEDGYMTKKIEIFQIKDGGGRHIENIFGYISSLYWPINGKLGPKMKNQMQI